MCFRKRFYWRSIGCTFSWQGLSLLTMYIHNMFFSAMEKVTEALQLYREMEIGFVYVSAKYCTMGLHKYALVAYKGTICCGCGCLQSP